MDAVTTRQAAKNLDSLIEKVIADVEPTILCNDQGQKAVLMSLDEFNSWQETLYLLSNPANAEHLRRSIEEARGERLNESEIDTILARTRGILGKRSLDEIDNKLAEMQKE
jgi:antitoxin YefM